MLNDEAKKEYVVYAYVDNDSYERTNYDMWFDEWKDEDGHDLFVINGNRDFVSYNEELIKGFDTLSDAYYEYENGYFKNFTDYVSTYISKKNGKAFSKRELGQIKKLVELAQTCYLNPENYCDFLQIITGKEYKHVCLRGYCQSDWIYMYCPTDTDLKEIEYIEAIYFGKGREVKIDDNIEFCDPYYIFYLDDVIWSDDELKQAIMDDTGATKVVLCQKEITYSYVEKAA